MKNILWLISLISIFGCSSITKNENLLIGHWGYCLDDGNYGEQIINENQIILLSKHSTENEIAKYSYYILKDTLYGIGLTKNTIERDTFKLHINVITEKQIELKNEFVNLNLIKIKDNSFNINSNRWFSIAYPEFKIRMEKNICQDQRTEEEKNPPIIEYQFEDILDISHYEDFSGIGLVIINFDDKMIMHFYSNPIDKEPLKEIEFFEDKTINSWNIRDLDKHKEWLKPETLWLDYSSFVFRCLSVKGNWLEVIINNENGSTLWIKKSDFTTIKDWETYLKEMFGVSRMSDERQKIRTSPSDNSDEIKYQGQDCFQVKSMKGDWIEIFTPDYCDEEYTDSKTKIKSGWIKWRQKNRLIINYFTTS